MSHSTRRTRTFAALAEHQIIDRLLVTNLLNVRWLTGFTGSSAQVTLVDGTATLITDSRYEDQAREQLDASVDVVITGMTDGERPNDHLRRLLGSGASGFEADHMTVATHGALVEAFEGSDVVWHAVDGLLAELRRHKDESELNSLRRAATIADEALAATLPHLRAGVTERQAARILEAEMSDRGSERTSFDTIMASGPNGAKPHARPTERVMEDGDLVVIDFGATVDGYGSDMTRTFVVGGEPTAEQVRWYENVAHAQQAGVAQVQVGAELLSIHTTTHDHLTASGQEGTYSHGTGHGVGLFIHESPILSARIEGLVEASMTLTVEPGAYIPGVGGVRVEDLVIATPDGPETITRFPKGLAPSL